MRDNRLDGELDEIIRVSMKLTDEPSPKLNNALKAALYQREASIRKTPAICSLSLWYLPMVLNLVTFVLLGIVALMAISNIYLSYFAAGICLYVGCAGVVLTMVGVKRANLKENITICVRRRGTMV